MELKCLVPTDQTDAWKHRHSVERDTDIFIVVLNSYSALSDSNRYKVSNVWKCNKIYWVEDKVCFE